MDTAKHDIQLITSHYNAHKHHPPLLMTHALDLFAVKLFAPSSRKTSKQYAQIKNRYTCHTQLSSNPAEHPHHSE